MNFTVSSFDVSAAYLNSRRDKGEKKLQIKPLKGMQAVCEHLKIPVPSDLDSRQGKRWVLALKSALYGLKSSARTWGLKLREVLEELGFVRCVNEGDECVYMRKRIGKDGKKHWMAVLTVVDDCLVLSDDNEDEISEFMAAVNEKYAITVQREPSLFLGFDISRVSGGNLNLSHDNYLMALWNKYEESLRKHGYWDTKNPRTPLTEEMDKAMKDEENQVEQSKVHPEFGAITGSLLFHVSNFTVEASQATSLLSSHLLHASELHFKCALHILAYLKGRIGKPFEVGRNTCKRPVGRELWCSVDADFANSSDKKSQTGFIIYFGSTPIAWVSRKQKSVSLSTTDAETKAATEACKEIIVLRRLLAFLGMSQDGPTPLLEDNSAVVTLTNDRAKQNANRLKYMEVRDKWVNECCNRGIVNVIKCPTEMQVADILTKTMWNAEKFERLRDLLYRPKPLEEMISQGENKTDV